VILLCDIEGIPVFDEVNSGILASPNPNPRGSLRFDACNMRSLGPVNFTLADTSKNSDYRKVE